MIVACDGVWDEMSSDEAVKIVADLIQNHESDPSKNIADMFIEKVLERAVQRIAVGSLGTERRQLRGGAAVRPSRDGAGEELRWMGHVHLFGVGEA